jgi:hypothetical protein
MGDPEKFESCAICGRTILRGERVSEYVTGDGERHRVCSLCKTRAEAAGWIPAEQAGAPERPTPRRSRGVALRDALSRAAERVRQPRPEPKAEPEPKPAPPTNDEGPPRRERRPAPAAKAKPAPKRAPVQKRKSPAKGQSSAKRQAKAKRETAGKGTAATKPQRSQASTAERRLRRAVERFNESDEAKVVGSLMRSLGEPRASVKSVSTKPPRVAVTVAWELSWYRWEVSQDGREVSVREVAKGNEVKELADEAKQWNATVDGEGNVRLALADARRQATKAAE